VNPSEAVVQKHNKNPFTSKIIRAPALLNDTKIFLSNWDEDLSVDENINKAIEENIFGRPARSYVKQFLVAFKERYLFGDARDGALRTLVRKGHDDTVINRILYYHTAQADPIIYEFVTEYLFDLHRRGESYLTTKEAQRYIRKLSDEGKTTKEWTDNVCNRVARNILTTLRDFMILEGNVKKKVAPVYLPIKAFVYIAYNLNEKVHAGEKVLNHPEWRLFLLDSRTVERLFLEAHQQKMLDYRSAGNIIRIEYPYKSTKEVVDAIV